MLQLYPFRTCTSLTRPVTNWLGRKRSKGKGRERERLCGGRTTVIRVAAHDGRIGQRLPNLSANFSRGELRRVDVHIGEPTRDAVEQRAERLASEASDQRRLRDHALCQHTVRASGNQALWRGRRIEPHHDTGRPFRVGAAVDVRLRDVLDVRGNQLVMDFAAVAADLEDRLALSPGVVRHRALSVSGQVGAMIVRLTGMRFGLNIQGHRDGGWLRRRRCVRTGATCRRKGGREHYGENSTTHEKLPSELRISASYVCSRIPASYGSPELAGRLGILTA